MANNNFYYNWDSPADQYDDYEPGTLFRRFQQGQRAMFPTFVPPTSIAPMAAISYPHFTSSSQSPQNLNRDDSTDSTSSSDGTKAQRWSDKEEECLVQKWKKFTRLESRHARVVWVEIAKAVGKTIPQCKRKLQY